MPPYTEAQIKTARAITHGWDPHGWDPRGYVGFSRAFAGQVMSESGGKATRKPIKKRGKSR